MDAPSQESVAQSAPAAHVDEFARMAQEDPATYETALASPDAALREEAVHAEIAAIEENATWQLARLPKGREALTCKLVFKRKYAADGTDARHKVRIVVPGYKQRYGVDFEETYAPVVDFEVVTLILAYYVARGARIELVDFVNAFLNGEIEEEVYIRLPPPLDPNGHVYKLLKSLYGLRQSPRNWFKKLHGALLELGFVALATADCVFVKVDGGDKVVVMVYVDDLVIVSNNDVVVEETKRNLGEKFGITDFGALRYFLGIKFDRSPRQKTID